MMISPAGANMYAAAAALDRQLRSTGDAPDDGSGSNTPDSGPDVVVTLSQGATSPSTYDATGKLSGAPTLDELGANAPDSSAKAVEAPGDGSDGDGGDAAAPSASASASASATASDAPVDANTDDASVDEDSTVAA